MDHNPLAIAKWCDVEVEVFMSRNNECIYTHNELLFGFCVAARTDPACRAVAQASAGRKRVVAVAAATAKFAVRGGFGCAHAVCNVKCSAREDFPSYARPPISFSAA